MHSFWSDRHRSRVVEITTLQLRDLVERHLIEQGANPGVYWVLRVTAKSGDAVIVRDEEIAREEREQ